MVVCCPPILTRDKNHSPETMSPSPPSKPPAAPEPAGKLKPEDYTGLGKGSFMSKLVALLKKRSAGGASLTINTVVKVWREEQGESLVRKYGMKNTTGGQETVLDMFRRLEKDGFVTITNTAKGQVLKTPL